MGLLSKEYSSGSVKLLFSSPITNWSIVLGKFGAMLVYGGIMLSVLLLYVAYSGIVIEHFDWGHAFAGVLGIFLLIMTYSAIGLFMSSLTSYPVVATVGTLALLAVLNYIGRVGQNINFIREITYWLALSGKTKDFVVGIVPSESLVYFLSLIIFFLYLTLLKLSDLRTRRNKKLTYIRYGTAVVSLLLISWVSSRPSCKFYGDWTATSANTLSEESQAILKKLDGPLQMTTYVNMLDNYNWREVLPSKIQEDKKRFEQYTRFKPEIKMDYVYYWDDAGNDYLQELYPGKTNQEIAELLCMANKVDFKTTLSPEEIRKKIDLSSMGNHVVRQLVRGNGEKDFLPLYSGHMMHPGESNITAILKHLSGERCRVAYVEKPGKYSAQVRYEGNWWSISNPFYEGSLLAMGFDIQLLDLTQETIPDNVEILIIPPLYEPLSSEELGKIKNYIEQGGNLFLMTEYGLQQNAEEIISEWGVHFTKEPAVCHSQNPLVVNGKVPDEAIAEFDGMKRIADKQKKIVVQENVTGISYCESIDFKIIPLLVSEENGIWLEKGRIQRGDTIPELNPNIGEQEGNYPFMVAMEREISGKHQRIIVASCAGWLNTDLYRWIKGPNYINYRIEPCIMHWLSEGQFPILADRPQSQDNRIWLGSRDRKKNSIAMVGILPLLVLTTALIIIKKRKRI